MKGGASISAALDTLERDNINERHNKGRLNLLLAILSNEERPDPLSYLYDELISTRPPDMAVNKAVFRGEPLTIYAKSSAYHNSFRPIHYEKWK